MDTWLKSIAINAVAVVIAAFLAAGVISMSDGAASAPASITTSRAAAHDNTDPLEGTLDGLVQVWEPPAAG
jgi:hypothetical protein